MAGTKRKIKKVAEDFFFLNFIGEYVQVTGGFSIQDGKAITSVDGYLLDQDDLHYYLGRSADEIHIAIKKDSVYSIEILALPDWRRDLLDDLKTPENDLGVN